MSKWQEHSYESMVSFSAILATTQARAVAKFAGPWIVHLVALLCIRIVERLPRLGDRAPVERAL